MRNAHRFVWTRSENDMTLAFISHWGELKNLQTTLSNCKGGRKLVISATDNKYPYCLNHF